MLAYCQTPEPTHPLSDGSVGGSKIDSRVTDRMTQLFEDIRRVWVRFEEQEGMLTKMALQLSAQGDLCKMLDDQSGRAVEARTSHESRLTAAEGRVAELTGEVG